MDIPQDFKCSICLGAIRNPIILESCKHNFCKDCFTNFASQGGSNCPICRKEFSEATDDLNLLMSSLKILVPCECGKVIPLIDVQEHETICSSHQNKLIQNHKILSEKQVRLIDSQRTVRCPFCCLSKLKDSQLIDHCLKFHTECAKKAAICPICDSKNIKGDNLFQDLIKHLQVDHKKD